MQAKDWAARDTHFINLIFFYQFGTSQEKCCNKCKPLRHIVLQKTQKATIARLIYRFIYLHNIFTRIAVT